MASVMTSGGPKHALPLAAKVCFASRDAIDCPQFDASDLELHCLTTTNHPHENLSH
jgi:hypothetical protein